MFIILSVVIFSQVYTYVKTETVHLKYMCLLSTYYFSIKLLPTIGTGEYFVPNRSWSKELPLRLLHPMNEHI